MSAEMGSFAYLSVASVADAPLAHHAISPPQRDEPKKHLQGRLFQLQLLKSNFWKISVLKGKLPLSFSQWKELADNRSTSRFLLRISNLLS